MQEISLDTNEILMIPKFCLRIYCLEIIDEKNTLPLSKVLICFEKLSPRRHLEVWRWSLKSLSIFADNI